MRAVEENASSSLVQITERGECDGGKTSVLDYVVYCAKRTRRSVPIAAGRVSFFCMAGLIQNLRARLFAEPRL